MLGIDRTHRTVVTAAALEAHGFHCEERLFYGGVYSAGEKDALFAVWGGR